MDENAVNRVHGDPLAAGNPVEDPVAVPGAIHAPGAPQDVEQGSRGWLRRDRLIAGTAMLVPGLLGLTSLDKAYWMAVAIMVIVIVASREVATSDLIALLRESEALPDTWRAAVDVLSKLAVQALIGYAGFVGTGTALGARSLVPVPGSSHVPNVTGATEQRAEEAIRRAGLHASASERCPANAGSSLVASQSPEAGVYVKDGAPVNLKFSIRVTANLFHVHVMRSRVTALVRALVVHAPGNALECEQVAFSPHPAAGVRIGAVTNGHDGTYAARVTSTSNLPVSIVAVAEKVRSPAVVLPAVPFSPHPLPRHHERLGQHHGRVARLVFITQPSGASVDGAFARQPVIQSVDRAGHAVRSYGDTVVLSARGDGGTLTGCSEASPMDGIVRFSGCKIDKPGTYTLQAYDQTALVRGESSPFTVTSPTLTLAFATQPAGASSGTPFADQPVVEVLDGEGHTVGGYGGKVSLLLVGSGSGVLSGCTVASNEGGQVRFSGCMVDKPGKFRLRASDEQTKASGESKEFAVAGVAASLVFKAQPEKVSVGSPFAVQPVVEVLDGEGHTVGGYGGKVSLLLVGSGSGVLSGCTVASNEGGLVRFSGCMVDKPGKFRLRASDEQSKASGESEDFEVTGS